MKPIKVKDQTNNVYQEKKQFIIPVSQAIFIPAEK
jgi:hypothetical protein